MVDLSFEVSGVEAEPFAVSPLLIFSLRIANLTPRARISNVTLGCQIRVEPARRAYRAEEKRRLADLFGAPDHWARSLRSFVFAHAGVGVPAFEEETTARLAVACTRDMAVASAKYFDGLVEGTAPLVFLFSGSIFYAQEGGGLQVEPIAWTKEASFSLPVATLSRLMTAHYGAGDWIRIDAATLERLRRYQSGTALLREADAVARLLDQATVEAAS